MKVPLNLRLDDELVAWLKARGKEENRSLTNLVDTVLRQYRAEQERKG
jgi:hypothetical protein